jgi:hypothetical protein
LQQTILLFAAAIYINKRVIMAKLFLPLNECNAALKCMMMSNKPLPDSGNSSYHLLDAATGLALCPLLLKKTALVESNFYKYRRQVDCRFKFVLRSVFLLNL